MFLRFLNWQMPTFSTLAIAIVFLSSCGNDEPIVITGRHYIEPAKQKKIPVSTSAFRVCADPNNLPFTNQKGEGFENKIAELIGRELNLPVEYTWFAQRRGFFRNTLREGRCDVVMGAPERTERALSTQPYYYSSYVFVSRKDRGLNIESLDDPLLRQLRIGVEMIGDDGINTPPAQTLAAKGLIDNIVGYTVYGDYSRPSPPSQIIGAVVRKDVDMALVWGPRAGYFAAHQNTLLKITPILPEADAKIPYVFGISIGLRYGEDEFKKKLNRILAEKQDEIRRILNEYNVPQVQRPEREFDLEVGQ